MKHRLAKYTIFTILFITSFALFAAKGKKASKQSQMPPAVVSLVKAQKKNWQPSIQVVGSLSAIEGITVSPEISGRITQIFFKSGQYIKKNKPIIEIYPNIIKAQLHSAEAQLHLSQVDYKRFYILYKKGFYDKADLDKALAKLESDKARVAQFQAQLDQTLIRAPFSGKLGLREISLGDYLSAGANITSLQSVDPMRIDFSIPEVYITQVKIGNKVKIISRALNKSYEGTIYAFNSIIDSNTRNLDMRATTHNPKHDLIPGTYVEVTVYLGVPKAVVMVPQTAIVYSADGNFVYLYIKGHAKKTIVSIGEKLVDNDIVIEKGLQTGDEVIIGGQMKIHDGDTVMTQAEAQKMFKK